MRLHGAGWLPFIVLGFSWAVATAAEPDGDLALEVVSRSGARPGFCVVLGETDGVLSAALGAGGRYVVHALAADPALLPEVREGIRAQGVYGTVSADCGAWERLPYADNLANLVVVNDAARLIEKGLALPEVVRVIEPYGAALLRGASVADVKARLANVTGADVCETGPWVRIAKRPHPGAGEWRQWGHDAAYSRTSTDTLVGPPRELRWIDRPRRGRNHNDGPVAAVSSHGRTFTVYDEAPPLYAVPSQWVLVCRNAGNGLMLWKRPLPELATFCRATLLADGERLYFVEKDKGALLELDAATGAQLREFSQRPTDVILVDGGLLLAGGGPPRLLDTQTGELRWTSRIVTIKQSRPVVAGGRVFVQEGGGASPLECTAVVCLDLETGQEVWRQSHKNLTRSALVTSGLGVLVFVSSKEDPLQVVSAEDGRYLWSHKYAHPGHGGSYGNVFVLGGMVWIHDNGSRKEPKSPQAWIGFDARTGEKKKTIETNLMQKCYRGAATGKYVLGGVMDFVDWQEGKVQSARSVRPVCGLGYFVANGMVYTFPTDCECNPWLRGSLGLSAVASALPAPHPHRPRLERGPASAASAGPEASAEDWPIYRGDAARRGRMATEVSANVKELWAAELGGRLSAPTVAAGMAFVASVDRHQVHALNAADGKLLWTFTAGGRVDGPPTYYKGLALFGCRDGWVYCLRASDGGLAWRFRAAPDDMRILGYGQPESAWPVYGSVLIDDGKAFFAAGRHTDLEGSVTVFALEAETGKLVWEKKPQDATLPDILIKGGKFLYMSQLRFDPVSGENGPARYGRFGHISGDDLDVDVKRMPDQDQPHFSAGPSSSFEDDTFAFRTQWVYNPVLQAQMLVFDEKRFICVRVLPQVVGLQKYSRTRPGQGDHCLWMNPRETTVEPQKSKPWYKYFSEPKGWTTEVPFRPRALVLANERVFACGPEDAYPAQKFALHCYSAADGTELHKLDLEAEPVFDGLAAAQGRLYLSTLDGKLRCFGKR